jgi:hypothetical protein
MAMEFFLGAAVRCSDGAGGKLTRIVLDPAERTVTCLAVEPADPGASGRLVPVDLVVSASGAVTLSCTRAQFDQLEPADIVVLARGTDYADHLAQDAVLGTAASPSATALGHQTPMVTTDAVPGGDSEVAGHERVHALDGQLGRIKGLGADQASHQVTLVLLREGHLWGSKDVAIPASVITAMDDGIQLSITKAQAQDLPPTS